jgi:hypothetical protein
MLICSLVFSLHSYTTGMVTKIAEEIKKIPIDNKAAYRRFIMEVRYYSLSFFFIGFLFLLHFDLI